MDVHIQLLSFRLSMLLQHAGLVNADLPIWPEPVNASEKTSQREEQEKASSTMVEGKT